MTRRILLFTVVVVAVAQVAVAGQRGRARAPQPESTTQAMAVGEGLLGPEAVFYDPQEDVFLVSNVNGGATNRDDNGFISRVSPDGNVLQLKWIDGAAGDVTLHAPKGLALRDDILFVADIDTVRLFNRKTGRPGGEWPIKGATYLNDMAVGGDGTIYVTDSGVSVQADQATRQGTGTVYRFEADQQQPTTLAQGDAAGGPSGIVAGPDGPVWVTLLDNKVYRVRGKDAQPEVIATLPSGRLEGIARLNDGGYVVSSWAGRSLYRVSSSGMVRQIAGDLETPAGLAVDEKRGRILLAQLWQNKLSITPLQ